MQNKMLKKDLQETFGVDETQINEIVDMMVKDKLATYDVDTDEIILTIEGQKIGHQQMQDTDIRAETLKLSKMTEQEFAPKEAKMTKHLDEIKKRD